MTQAQAQVQAQAVADFGTFIESQPAGIRQPQTLAGPIVEFFVPQLDQLIHQLGGIDMFIDTAQKAYDQYVTPIDLPGIPNLIEPAVDAAARHAIGVILRAIHDRIHKP